MAREIAKICHLPDHQAEEQLESLQQLISKGNRARECTDSLRFCAHLMTSRYLEATFDGSYAKSIFNLIQESKNPRRVHLLAQYLIKKLIHKGNHVIGFPIDSFEDLQVVFFLTGLTLSFRDERDVLQRTLNVLCEWFVNRPAESHPEMLSGLMSLAILQPTIFLSHPEEPTRLSKRLSRWLSSTATSSFMSSTSSSFWKITTTSLSGNAILEIDGQQSRGFFTVMNTAQRYTPEQICNILAFSFARYWLTNFHRMRTPSTDESNQSDIKTVGNQVAQASKQENPSEDYQNVLIDYCARLLQQCELRPVEDPNPANRIDSVERAITVEYTDAVLVEVLTIYISLTSRDSSLLEKFLPAVVRIYSINSGRGTGLPLLYALDFMLQFSTQIGSLPLKELKGFFSTFVPKNFVNSLFGTEFLRFCLRHQSVLSGESGIFAMYFPSLFKVLAWHPLSVFRTFAELLPCLVTPENYLEVFHCILDLPIIAASLEDVEATWDRARDPGPDFGQSPFRAMFNYILRNESGVSINFWESSTTFDLLRSYSEAHSNPSPRVKCICEIVPQLLSTYFEATLPFGTTEQLSVILNTVLERYNQIFMHDVFEKGARKVMLDALLQIISYQPGFVLDMKNTVLSLLSEATHRLDFLIDQEELILNLIWAVGEYLSPTTDPRCSAQMQNEFYEAVELYAYEKISFVKSSLIGDSDLGGTSTIVTPSTFGKSPKMMTSLFDADEARLEGKDAYIFQSRTLLLLISTLTKLASRRQDFIPRAVICFNKISSVAKHVHPAVFQRAKECEVLLRFPSIASSVMNPANRPTDWRRASNFHHTQDSSLGMRLFSLSSLSIAEPMHSFDRNSPHAQQNIDSAT